MLTRSDFFSRINHVAGEHSPYTHDGSYVDIDLGVGIQRTHTYYINNVVFADKPIDVLIALEQAWEWYVEEYNNP